MKLHHRIHKHLKQHHKKYILGIFGSFAVVKAVILFAGFLGLIHLGGTFAQTPLEINSTNITQAPFNCATSATSCNLNNKGITSIATNTFINHNDLTNLQIYNNHITSIEHGDFNGPSSLMYLNLGANDITSIESGSFNGLSSLTSLYLIDNQIPSIEYGDFNGLSSLVSLNIQSNQITSIESGSFNGLSTLKYLYLHANQITSIEHGDFNGLSSLNSLDVSMSQIVSIESGSFDGLPVLTDLYLYENQIVSIEKGWFTNLPALNFLDISMNHIVSIESGSFDGLSALIDLYLYENQIVSIPNNLFNDLSNLTTLDLSVNQIVSIENSYFNGLFSLEFLYLSYNQILSVEGDSFAGLSYLNALTLQSNLFATLPESMTGLVSLSYLGLDTNCRDMGSMSANLISFLNNKAGNNTWQISLNPLCPVLSLVVFNINNNDVSTTVTGVTLTISTTPAALNMRFSNDGTNRSTWEGYFTTKANRPLSPGYGTKTVYVEFDADGDEIGDVQKTDTINYPDPNTNGGGNNGIECGIGEYCGDLTLEITGGVIYCQYGTTIDFGSTGFSYTGIIFSTGFLTTGGFNEWFCEDKAGRDERDLTIQVSDLQNLSTNNLAHAIAASHVTIQSPDAYLASGSCTIGIGDSHNQPIAIDTPKVILSKVGQIMEGCKIMTNSVDLKVAIPPNQAVGQYSGTITISIP